MKILVVYGHPHTKGHNGLVLKNVKKELEGTNYEVLNLYKMSFSPLLTSEELEGKIPKNIKDIQKKISESDKLIFIFPVWWNGPPAILKGFLDRVFSVGFAYRYINVIGKLGRPIGLLKGKKAAVFTTSGSPKWIYRLFEGSRCGKIVAHDTLKLCGIKAKVFHFGFALQVDDRARTKISSLARRGIYWLLK